MRRGVRRRLLLRRRLRLLPGLHHPMIRKWVRIEATMQEARYNTTHEMSKEVEEVDKVVEHDRWFGSRLLFSPHEQVISPEASGLMDMLEARIGVARASDERSCTGTFDSFALCIRLPLVYTMTAWGSCNF